MSSPIGVGVNLMSFIISSNRDLRPMDGLRFGGQFFQINFVYKEDTLHERE